MKKYTLKISVIVLFAISVINAQEQCISQVPGSPFSAGIGPIDIAFTPIVNGNLFAAVTNNGDNTVSVYAVNTTTGVFTPVVGSPFATGAGPSGISISPLINGNIFAAIANQGNNTISVYCIDQATGFFTPVTGSPFTAPVNNQASVAYSPIINGNLFAASVGLGAPANLVSVYSVTTTSTCPTAGAFSAGTTFATGTGPRDVAISPAFNGTVFAGVANGAGNSISMYTLDASGSLTPVAGSPFGTGAFNNKISFSPVFNNKLYLGVNNPLALQVEIFSVSSTGALTLIQTISLGTGIADIAFSPVINGKLYAAIPDSISVVHIYSVDATTGLLTEITGPFPTAASPTAASFSPVVNNQLLLGIPNSVGVTVYRIGLPPVITTASSSCVTRFITATGSAEPNSTLELFANGALIGTGSSDSSSNFTITSTVPLADGTYAITVNQTSGSCTGTTSNSVSVIISCPIPPVPPIPPIPPVPSNQSDLVRAIRNKYCPLLQASLAA